MQFSFQRFSRRALAPLILTLCGTLALVGCTPASKKIVVPQVSVTAVPKAVDSSKIDNLVFHTLQETTGEKTETDREQGFVTIEGNTNFSALINSFTFKNSANGPGITKIGWNVPVAAGNVFAERISVTEASTNGVTPKVRVASFYTFIDSKEAVPASSLIAKDKLVGAAKKVLQTLSEAKTPALQADLKKPVSEQLATDIFTDVVIDSDSGLTVVLHPGSIIGDSGSATAVKFNAKAAQGLLSNDGKAVLEQVISKRSLVPLPKPVQPVRTIAGPPNAPGNVDCSKVKCIALTFDDGPGAQTPRLLQILKEEKVKATFFIVGNSIGHLKHILVEELADGHAVGGHSWDHPALNSLSPEKITEQLRATNDAIKGATGFTPGFYRPPYGAVNPTVAQISAEQGQAMVMWNIDTEDWKNKDPKIITERAVGGASPGSIILMHDIHATTVDAVPGIISALRAQGYTFVTIPQLFGGKLVPGKKYFSLHEKR